MSTTTASPTPARSILADFGTMFALSALSVALLSLIFPPRGGWLLGFVALVPWAAAVVRIERPWVVHWGSFLAGYAFFLFNLRWLNPVTGPGFFALAFYLAIYWTLAAWALRTGRRAGIPPGLSLPVAWVACEYLRAWVMSGFPWLFVAHGYSEQLPLIQISDITGAYGVTFVVLAVSGALLEWVLTFWQPTDAPQTTQPKQRRTAIIATAAATAMLAFTLGYGVWRINSATFEEGPRVAVVQEDFPLVSTPPYGDPVTTVFARYMALAAQAAAEAPDLIAFPETAWQGRQNIDFVELEREAVDDESANSWAFGKRCHEATSAFAAGDYPRVNLVIAYFESLHNRVNPDNQVRLPRLPAAGGPPTPLIVGSVAIDVLPESTYPSSKRYNSALKYRADGTQLRERYDKKHLVPFGEIVPFRNAEFLGISFHWLYNLLNALSPFSNGGTVDYSLWPGEDYTVFQLRTRATPTADTQSATAPQARTYRFGVPICYEDVMPYICREFSWQDGRRRVDFLINISNDGWFLYSDELPQHLAICVFRAIENRVGIARAVNTGISGFIDPNGRLYDLVEEPNRRYGRGVIGYRVAPVMIDDRTPIYGLVGDLFARLCLLGASALWFAAVITRWVFALRKWILHRFRRT